MPGRCGFVREGSDLGGWVLTRLDGRNIDNVGGTYRKPKVNSRTTPTFLLTVVLRFQETLTGINKISMSVRVLKAPLALSRLGMLTHVPGFR